MVRDSGLVGGSQGSRRSCWSARLRTPFALAIAAGLGILVIVNPGLSWNEPEGFKGVRWGSPPEELQRILAPSKSCPFQSQAEDDGTVSYWHTGLMAAGPCEWTEAAGERMGTLRSIGDLPIKDLTFRYDRGRLGQVAFGFNVMDFGALRETFKQAYGEPTSSGPSSSSSPGSTFWYPERLVWEGKRLFISLALVQSITGGSHGSAIFNTVEFLDARSRADKARTRERARGL